MNVFLLSDMLLIVFTMSCHFVVNCFGGLSFYKCGLGHGWGANQWSSYIWMIPMPLMDLYVLLKAGRQCCTDAAIQ